MAPHDGDEDLIDDEPPTCEPYTVLGIEKSATSDEIKSAYRKAALKQHPDKAPPNQKEEATVKFQELVFAYSVLSDPVRRKRYDTTGSISESLEAGGDFSWADYFRSQFADVVTSESIEKFSQQYKGSDEEKDDVLAAYEQYKGGWGAIYARVMLSDPLQDEDRFRVYIDGAIESGDVEAFKAYTQETEKQKEARMKRARQSAQREAKEAAEHMSAKDKSRGEKKDSGEDSLAAIIKARQAQRNGSYMDAFAERWGANEPKKAKGKKGRKRTSEDEDEDKDQDDGMPSEEAFQAAAARLSGPKASGSSKGRKAKKVKR